MSQTTENSKTSLDSREDQEVLAALKTVRDRRHGDLQISVVNGRIVKIWEVIKHDYRKLPLNEGGS